MWQRYDDKAGTARVIHVTYEDNKAASIAFEGLAGTGPFNPKVALALVGLELEVSRAPIADRTIVRIGGENAWPVFILRDLWASDDAFRLANTNVNVADDDAFVLIGVADDPFDENSDLVGTAKDEYLGTHGAQVGGALSDSRGRDTRRPGYDAQEAVLAGAHVSQRYDGLDPPLL